MALILSTDSLNLSMLDSEQNLWVYNGFDCCITHELSGVILPQLQADPEASFIYDFERALQAPVLEMDCRGLLVDQEERFNAVQDLQARIGQVDTSLQLFANAAWGKDLNPLSPKQMLDFFYGHLSLPPIIKRKSNGSRGPSTDRESLEKLRVYFHAKPIINCILRLRDLRKKLGVLKSGVDSDGRMRTSYNIAGTVTGRFSSSGAIYSNGINFQNITDSLRRIFVADPGKKLAYIDLEQAESRMVGLIVYLLFNDSTYLDACEQGDLHTVVCRMVWPELAWTGDLAHDRKVVAESLFYRNFSYRDMSKRGGHGTNYYGQPFTMAKHLKVETQIMEIFQSKYFSAFEGIPRWHAWVIEQIQNLGQMTSLTGRKRCFFGRRDDDATIREAIANDPQGAIGDLLNFGMWKVWKQMGDSVELLAQVHDAILIQYDEEREDELIPQVLDLLTIKCNIHGRPFSIPCEAQSGWNWSKYLDPMKAAKYGLPTNLDGIKDWSGNDTRQRTKAQAKSLLDIRL